MALQTDVAVQRQAHELIMFDWKNGENTHSTNGENTQYKIMGHNFRYKMWTHYNINKWFYLRFSFALWKCFDKLGFPLNVVTHYTCRADFVLKNVLKRAAPFDCVMRWRLRCVV